MIYFIFNGKIMSYNKIVSELVLFFKYISYKLTNFSSSQNCPLTATSTKDNAVLPALLQLFKATLEIISCQNFKFVFCIFILPFPFIL